MAASARHQREPARARSHEPARRAPITRVSDRITAMQRSAGNKAVAAALAARTGGTVQLTVPARDHRTVAMMHAEDVRARLPTFADLRATMTDKTLNISEDVIRTAVTQLLGRMAVEKRLKSNDPVATIVTKIFPGPGEIDKAEFEKAVDPADRTQIYENVLDACTKVRKDDQNQLKELMTEAQDLIRKAVADDAGRKAVFGTEASAAKARYTNAGKALATVAADLDTYVTTDYNLDDKETIVNGWSTFRDKRLHLLIGVVKGTDAAESKIVLIHEAAHLGTAMVDDLGYYGTPGFEAMSEEAKVRNAAHFEELPRRLLGRSSYVGKTFTPDTLSNGVAVTREDTIRKQASDRMRDAWVTAGNAHMWLRSLLVASRTKNDTAEFTKHEQLIMDLSRHVDMTVHRQDKANARSTTLDITIIESVTRAMELIRGKLDAEQVPGVSYSEEDAADVMIAGATKIYGQLLGDPTRDKALVGWLVAHVRKIPRPL